MFGLSRSGPLMALLLIGLVVSAQASGVKICNYSNTTYYLTLRTERSFLLGGGYYTKGWHTLEPDHGLFNPCWFTDLGEGWTEYYVFSADGQPAHLTLEGAEPAEGVSVCIKEDDGFDYVSTDLSDASCAEGHRLFPASFSVTGGSSNYTNQLTIR
jgi:hypothetical protein